METTSSSGPRTNGDASDAAMSGRISRRPETWTGPGLEGSTMRRRRPLATGDHSLEELRRLRPRVEKGDLECVGRYPYDGYEEAKPHIFERDGYTCQSCGAKWEEAYTFSLFRRLAGLQVPGFVVHHINGDPRDQRWVNLEVLCEDCHHP